jgi:putative flavoprotein involved in K+ transport
MEPVVIIGAGPAGLATAACLKRLGIGFTLLDRTGKPGGSFCRMARSMRLLSPRAYVGLPHWPYSGREEYPGIPDYEGYLQAYAAQFGLRPEEKEVAGVKKVPEGFEVRCQTRADFRCRFLVTATGVFSNPVWPQLPGLTLARVEGGNPFVLHAQDWSGPSLFDGRRVLIIGAGISGVSIAEECARAGQYVLLSRREGRTRLVPPTLLGRDILHWFRPVEFLPRVLFSSICRSGVHPPAYNNGYRRFVANGQIRELPEVTQVAGTVVNFVDGSREEVDVIIAATGYQYETLFLPAEVSRAPGGHPLTKRCESVKWPGLFFLGSPCARKLDSEFLRGIASDAEFVARQIARRLRLRS